MVNNVLHYKGYIAKAMYDVDRQVICGKVDGLVESVDFATRDPAQVEQAFHEAVDGYLAFCENVGRRPCQPYKGQFSVRVGADLHRAMVEWAMAHDMTLNKAVVEALASFLRENEE